MTTLQLRVERVPTPHQQEAWLRHALEQTSSDVIRGTPKFNHAWRSLIHRLAHDLYVRGVRAPDPDWKR
jgi:hypothetical protein